jgi:hypothetical protein
MTFDEEIKLVKYTKNTNEFGDSIEIPVKRAILASKIEYRSKAHYQAMANGLKPSKTFAINKYEYQDEVYIDYNETLYRIIDIYPIKARNNSEFETLALICERTVNKNANA